MILNNTNEPIGTILIVGTSRGLGHAMVAEFLKRGWTLIGTVCGMGRTLLHDLVNTHPGRVAVEQLDVTEPEQIAARRNRLSGQAIDMLFVNAGTASADQDETIAEVSAEEFFQVMVTNALSPMRVLEGLQDRVAPAGLIGIMSSGQGSIANKTNCGHEVYRGSKAALNQYMRSYAARHAGESWALILMVPGWIRTDLGGPDAQFGMEEIIPQIVTTLLAEQGRPGLRYLDRKGQSVPW